MWVCPVCGNIEKSPTLCTGCGFDGSADREQYPTLMLTSGGAASVRKQVQERKNAEKAELADLKQQLLKLRELVDRQETAIAALTDTVAELKTELQAMESRPIVEPESTGSSGSPEGGEPTKKSGFRPAPSLL